MATHAFGMCVWAHWALPMVANINWKKLYIWLGSKLLYVNNGKISTFGLEVNLDRKRKIWSQQEDLTRWKEIGWRKKLDTSEGFDQVERNWMEKGKFGHSRRIWPGGNKLDGKRKIWTKKEDLIRWNEIGQKKENLNTAAAGAGGLHLYRVLISCCLYDLKQPHDIKCKRNEQKYISIHQYPSD